MKKLIFIIFMMAFAMKYSRGQNALSPVKAFSLEMKNVSEELAKDKKVKSYAFVDIKLDLLKKGDITIQIFDNAIQVTNKRIDVRNESNFSWFGKATDGVTDVIITVLNNDVYATIANQEKAYKIITKQGVYVAVEEHKDMSQNKSCGSDHVREADNNNDNNETIPQTTTSVTHVEKDLVTNFDCGLRILFMYTSEAVLESGNIDLSAQHCVDQLNQSFINSDIARTAQVAGVMPAFYTEAESFADVLEDFVNPSDGNVDHVFDIMDLFSADMSVLLTYRPSHWFTGKKYTDGAIGMSSYIKACSGQALAAVDVEYAAKLNEYTFCHEIGHLLGGRHNVEVDPSTTPYSYGHGFWYSTLWSTIMTVNIDERRILYWSNPSISYGGIAMGNASCNDAQVVRDNVINAMTYRESMYTRNVGTINIPEHLIYNAGNLTNNVLNISSGQHLTLIAGKEVKLKDGFKASGGSEFLGRIKEGCGTADGLSCGYGGDSQMQDLLVNSESDSPLKLANVNIYPNPAENYIYISWFQESSNDVSIRIFDLKGIEVGNIPQKKFNGGNQQIAYSIEQLSAGTYIIDISSGSLKKEIRLIKR